MKIIFFGDSITESCFELFANPAGGINVIKDADSGYPLLVTNRLKKFLPDAKIEMINAGIGGNTSEDGLKRVEKDVIEKCPDITVVCFGLNDVANTKPENYGENMAQIFKIRRNANIQTVFMTPNMVNTYVHPLTLDILNETAEKCAACQNNGTMDLFIQKGLESALNNDAVICDVYSVWKKLKNYGVDTTELLCNYINHPIRQMHRLFADLLEPLLNEKIKRPF